MQMVQTVKTSPEPRSGWRLNGRLIAALVFDIVAWGLLIAAGWGALKLLKLV